MNVQILGKSTYTKDGVTSTTLYFKTPFKDFEISGEGRSADGFKVGHEWTRLDCSSVKVGESYDFAYEKGFQDKAQLSAIYPVSSKK